MIKEVMYVYLGTNGTICSPIHLEDIYYIRKYRLWADPNMQLTKDGKTFVNKVIVSENDIVNWKEVPINGQK